MKRIASSFVAMIVALCFALGVQHEAKGATSTSESQLHTGTFGAEADGRLIPILYQWRGKVHIDYTRNGNDITINKVDQTVLIYQAGRFNAVPDMRATISLQVLANGSTPVHTIKPSRFGPYFWNHNDKLFGGISEPKLVVQNPSFKATMVVYAQPGSGDIGSYTRSWTFSLPNEILPLYRYWNPYIGDHFYTTNWNELGAGGYGYTYERDQGRMYSHQVAGTVPLYRYWNPYIGDHFYTTNWNELGAGGYGYTYERVQGYAFTWQASGTVPLYRYWNPYIGDHFYTTNWLELGTGTWEWVYEGIRCFVFP